MNRREFFLGAAGAYAAVARAQFEDRERVPAPGPDYRPNMIWLFGDQHRGQALGSNGDPNARTPNMDRIASLGVNFTNAVSGFPLCCPFRGTLLTGRYAHNCVPGHEYPLPADQPTITQPFKEAGYHTAWFGKWHLGGWHERDGRAAMFIVPPERRGGFHTWVGYENNNSQWDCWVHGGIDKDAFHYRLPGYETDALTDLFIKYIRERGTEQQAGKGKPFFAALSVQPPHNPYVAPEEYMRHFSGGQLQLRPNVPPVPSIIERARRELAGYYAQIENLDHNVGRILTALREAGLEFNTHIMLFSDHGDQHGSHGQFLKVSPYAEALSTPMLIGGEHPAYNGRLTGRPPALFNTVDIAPTTLGLCGIRKPAWMPGFDYSSRRIARPGTQGGEPDSAYLENVVPTGHPDSVNRPFRGVVTRDGWKYVVFEGAPFLMFNLNEDPYEMVNLAFNNRYRAERRKLADRIAQWVTETGDKFSVPRESTS